MSQYSDPSSDKAPLVRLLRATGYPERSIYRWLSTGRGPRDQHGAKAWAKALAAAKTKLAKAGEP